MPNVQRLLEKRVEAAMHAAFPEAEGAPLSGVAHRAKTDALVLPAQDPSFGDYQANGAMALAKRLGKKPRDVAEQVIAHLHLPEIITSPPEIAGPGFINFHLDPDRVGAELGQMCADKDERLGVATAVQPETVVVDYSAPNLAKEMHVGHLRSTIIGDALVRMLQFAGHTVVKQNHVGDWGTQFGMLLEYMHQQYAATGTLLLEESGETKPFANTTGKTIARSQAEAALLELGNNLRLGDLEVLYRRAKEPFDKDPTPARQRVRLLQSGDSFTLAMWRMFTESSVEHCRRVYRRLGALLTDADVRGESAYNDDLPIVIEALKAKGMLVESEGAQCIFVKDADGKPLFVNREGEPLPLIVQKSDEGFLYATTDLAAIRYRVIHLKASRILYVVDARQALHFEMVFECARQAGFAPEGVKLEHVAFGTMMGLDGRPFKTREGGTVKLMDLLNQAEERAGKLVKEKNPDLMPDEQKKIAHIVGIGAVKYADLAQNRTSDYVFSWEKMLSLAGNTAPYMQYAYARVRSIFRKGGEEAETHRADAGPIPLEAAEELALAKMLLRFPETLDRAIEGYQPNVLAAYLYDLAQSFTAFYGACPVLKSEAPVRRARLRLCDLVARTIAKGLDLLGIEVADRM